MIDAIGLLGEWVGIPVANSLEVVEGLNVENGAVIAAVGSTGKSTGPHLHFDVRRDGRAENPADLVEDWRK